MDSPMLKINSLLNIEFLDFNVMYVSAIVRPKTITEIANKTNKKAAFNP